MKKELRRSIRNFSIISNLIFFVTLNINSYAKEEKLNNDNIQKFDKNSINQKKIASINWENLSIYTNENNEIIWRKFTPKGDNNDANNEFNKKNLKELNNKYLISSLNRSIVIGDKAVGPDISWLVPPGFKWSKIINLTPP